MQPNRPESTNASNRGAAETKFLARMENLLDYLKQHPKLSVDKMAILARDEGTAQLNELKSKMSRGALDSVSSAQTD
jgi:hypothetical protein